MLNALRPRHQDLRIELALQREMTPLLEKEIIAATDAIVPDRANWVRMWVDTGNSVSLDRSETTAYRGIDEQGRLLWLVRRLDKKHGYHSLEADPLAAIDEARTAWDARRRVRENWDRVEEIQRALLLGRERFQVTIDDARRSPLCTVGVEAFLRRMRIANVRCVSGRTAALLMVVEEQVGFVIHAAHERYQEDTAHPG